MIRKYTVLTLTLLLAGTKANSMTYLRRFSPAIMGVIVTTGLTKLQATSGLDLDTDFVYYNQFKNDKGIFISASASTRFSSFVENDSEIQKADQALKEEYQLMAGERNNSGEKTFYRCMAELHHPSAAVRTNEYKKCINKSLPWATTTTIKIDKQDGHGMNRHSVVELKKRQWYERKAI